MTVRGSLDSYHTVMLSVDGVEYTANLWRGGDSLWKILSIEIQGQQVVEVTPQTYPSCQATLESAEALSRRFVTDGGSADVRVWSRVSDGS